MTKVKITKEEYNKKIKETLRADKGFGQTIEEAKKSFVEIDPDLPELSDKEKEEKIKQVITPQDTITLAKHITGCDTDEELRELLMANTPRLRNLKIADIPKGHIKETLLLKFKHSEHTFSIEADITYHNNKNRLKRTNKVFNEVLGYMDSLTLEEVIKRGEFNVTTE